MTPTCNYCPRSASVAFRFAAAIEHFYCGLHAEAILGTTPAEFLAATERAA